MTPPKHRECPDPAKWLAYLDARTEVDANGCHNFTGHIASGGYGRFKWYVEGVEHRTGAHRAAWLARRGPIDGDLTIDHLCRNTRCINVEHMELVSDEENRRRSTFVPGGTHRRVTGEVRLATSDTYPCGSPRTEENTRTSRTSRGGIQRTCLHCYREHNRRAAERRRTVSA